ncbi:retrovirus-related pol polyprotein from transposon TNT 1-94 [Tanacetum coccineum]
MYIASLKRSENYKDQPYQYASSSKQILREKANPFPPYTHCGFNDHIPDDCRNYPKCEICGSYDHSTLGHYHVIQIRGGVLAESSLSNESSIGVMCNTYGSTVQSTSKMNFITSKERHIREPIRYLDSGCSRSMTGVKSYLHKYVEQLSPKVVFGDNSSCITEGYGSINCGGIVLTKVAFVNGLKYNLISISQLCNAKYIVQFDDKQGTIFNSNKEIVLIAPRRNDVYVLDMSSLTLNGVCFFAKASENVNWERIPDISYFHVFGCLVFIYNHKDHLGKFDAKVNDGYFLGYSSVSKAFRVYNTRRQQIEETYHVTFDESMEAIRWSRDQHIELVNIIGDLGEGMLTRSMAAKLIVASASECLFANFLSKIKPKRNKKDEHGTTTKNKARLVAQGYSQEEGIDYDETFSPVARMEAIRIFLVFSTYMNFKVYQIDVKSAFLNGKLKEKVYVKQPPDFKSSEFPGYVCKLDKALYGLKQAPMAWHKTLSTFLIQNKFVRGRIDNTLFIYKSKGEDLLVQVYVDDIIFGSTSYKLCKQFEKLMTKKFEISMIGELTYFLGLQIKQDDKEILIYQEQYTRNLLKKYEISDSSSVKHTKGILKQLSCEKNPQNFLREFWSTVVAFDPFPSTDEPEKCPLKEFLIKFLVLNGRSSTGLNYNNGKYVDHPTPKVLGWNYSSTEQVNFIQQLLAYNLITRTEVDIGEIIYSDLVTKLLNKSRLKYVSYPRFISCALQVLLYSKYTQDKKFGFLPPILSNSNFKKDPSKVTNIELTAHMIAINNQRDLISLPPLVAKPKKGKSQTVASTLPKDTTSTTPNEGTTKTTSRPEGSLGDKDLGGNIPPADTEPIHTPVADPSGTEPDTEPLKLQTYDDIQAFLLSDDELDKESDEEEVLAAGNDIDEDPQDDKEVRTPSPKQDQPEPSHVQESASDSSSPDLKKFDNILPLTERQLIKYLRRMSRASIDRYYNENIDHRDQTDKLMEAYMSSLDRSNTTISDLYKGLDIITKLLKDINTAIKDDLATNQKINEATKTFAKISFNITEDTSEIKSMMTEMYATFQGQSSLAPLGTVTPTLALTDIQANIDKGKGIITESDDDPSKKLVKALSIVRPDPDEPVRKAEEEARLLAMSKPKVIKVVQEEAEKIRLDPKAIKGAKAGKMFKKAQDAEHVVLKRQHTEKVRKSLKLRKHKNFEVHKPFLFGAFGTSELDELRGIIPKKKNVVPLNKPHPDPQEGNGSTELEPETRIPGLECNRSLLENVPFINNMVIEEPEYGIFFTDDFRDQAFQRWSDIDKVGMEALV